MPGDMGAERRTLSSAQTFFVKFMGPAFFIPVVAYLVYLMARSYAAAHPADPVPWALSWFVLAAAFLYSLWWSFKLKRVVIAGESIYISDYSKEVALPLSAIVDVRENRWLKLHPVTITFDRDTPWGSEIKFMPRIRWFAFNWTSHPVVRELREMAFDARASGRASLGIESQSGDPELLDRALAFDRSQPN
jgi:hypothetical protein